MISYSKITEIFCVIDEFCKEYDQIVETSLLGNPPKRPPIMSKSEVLTISVLFHLGGFRTFKHFYIYYVQVHMQNEFPHTVSYNRFVELRFVIKCRIFFILPYFLKTSFLFT